MWECENVTSSRPHILTFPALTSSHPHTLTFPSFSHHLYRPRRRQVYSGVARARWAGINAAPRRSSRQAMAQRGFEEAVLPHLDAAFNYARWLARDDVEAEDVVQDAYVRALRFFPSLRSDDARAWLLAIVRNTFYSRVSKRPGQPAMAPWDREADDRPGDDPDPEALVLRQQTVERVREA